MSKNDSYTRTIRAPPHKGEGLLAQGLAAGVTTAAALGAK
jgi:hypothetical protein